MEVIFQWDLKPGFLEWCGMLFPLEPPPGIKLLHPAGGERRESGLHDLLERVLKWGEHAPKTQSLSHYVGKFPISVPDINLDPGMCVFC